MLSEESCARNGYQTICFCVVNAAGLPQIRTFCQLIIQRVPDIYYKRNLNVFFYYQRNLCVLGLVLNFIDKSIKPYRNYLFYEC
jgi:hypothetical protein